MTLWEPQRSLLPIWPGLEAADSAVLEPNLGRRRFPVLRGTARPPLDWVARFRPTLSRRLLAHTPDPQRSVLVCTTPCFAAVAERWPGPVVYWLTDLIAAYEGIDAEAHRRLDARLCQRANLVCPNSERIGSYLREQAGCPKEKIEIIPNATRARNTLPEPLRRPAAVPEGLPLSAGPFAGVLGALGSNMDWVFLQRLQRLVPWLSWAFVGPADLRVGAPAQRRARREVLRSERSFAVGPKPYGELFRYARAFTVGVLPYRQREPTFSGSSTRFYEHLAACHPMLATPGVAELLQKEPLLRLASTPEQGAAVLEEWRLQNFDDGQRQARWEASLGGTWTERGRAMRRALAARTDSWPAQRVEASRPEMAIGRDAREVGQQRAVAAGSAS